MPDAVTASGGQASRACSYLVEISPEMRGCAILDSDYKVLAATGDAPSWEGPARELAEAADAAGDEPAAHVHVSTADGDVFMVRGEELMAIAVTERLALASLVLFDLRAALRDLAEGAAR